MKRQRYFGGSPYDLDPPEVYGQPQPRCFSCGCFLAWEPVARPMVAGMPERPFVQMREVRICNKCGTQNDESVS